MLVLHKQFFSTWNFWNKLSKHLIKITISSVLKSLGLWAKVVYTAKLIIFW